ncbi:hypothetical protein P171DRAFT_431551 [Karstenula rhodostoma CBS 690.94]|uniref:Uncharacterized protein n=1 Tax=Karstenula rhodostoma CBS 690.94 TaxID=1392251 RepID=A0A9P4UAQ1_9PLEO|nr:hypothetical protein P171DRAFT_431551 [Karstenula rhodostoma CBS 690.94]
MTSDNAAYLIRTTLSKLSLVRFLIGTNEPSILTSSQEASNMATPSASPNDSKAPNSAAPVPKEEPRVTFDEAHPVTNEEVLAELKVSRTWITKSKWWS